MSSLFTGELPFSSKHRQPYIALAPMEGLMDYHLRDILTAVGGIDHCVTEFVRVIDHVYPAKVFRRLCPELHHGGKTRAGTPVHLQLLGSNPETMAANARKAAMLGAPAIDLNFGCPAKTVNKSMGGSILLQWPEQLFAVASAVRKAVPSHIPVSAKMRLGFNDKSLALENALALDEADIQWLSIHARTKLEGYKPPAHWEQLKAIKEAIKIPVFANGEVWTVANAKNCLEQSQCDLLMIGRGLVSMPDLGLQIKAAFAKSEYLPLSWQDNLRLFLRLVPTMNHLSDKSATDRLKQWLFYFTRHFTEIEQLFDQVKREKEKQLFLDNIHRLLS